MTPQPPSPIRVRPHELVRALGGRGHEVQLASTVWNSTEAADVNRLQRRGLKVLAAQGSPARRVSGVLGAAVRGAPLQSGYNWQPELARRLDELVGQAARDGQPFDVAHVEHLRAAQYALRLTCRLPVMWDSVDSISLLFERARSASSTLKGRLMTSVELARTRRYEGRLVRRFDAVTVTSEQDREALLALADGAGGNWPDNRRGTKSAQGAAVLAGEATSRRRDRSVRDDVLVSVVPNGVDTERFTPPDAPRESGRVVFSGKFSYHANVTAASYLVEQVMPRVWAQLPRARLVLAGAEPSAQVRALADRQPGRVTVTGFVDDLGAEIGRASVAVAPIVYGVGVQNKVLEALATATPVVATPAAVQGIPGDVLGVVVGDGTEALAAALAGLLQEPDRASALGAAGRAFVERRCTWDGAAEKLEEVYAIAIERGGMRLGSSVLGAADR